MQFSRILTYPKKLNGFGVLWPAARITIILLVGFVLISQASKHLDGWQQLQNFNIEWSMATTLSVCLVILLMPVNWLLEARRWQLLCVSESIKMFDAIKSVIIGLSLESIMPFGTGAATGRVMNLKTKDRSRNIPMAFLGQWIQTLVTLLAGIYGCWKVFQKDALFQFNFTWEPVAFGILVLAVAWAFLRKKRAIINIKDVLQQIAEIRLFDWVRLLFYSCLRYVVFLTQFVLLLQAFIPMGKLNILIALATWVFVARTVMPRLSSLETLGIRAAAGWYFSSLYALPVSEVMLAILMLWFINLLIPSIIGLFYFSELKISLFMVSPNVEILTIIISAVSGICSTSKTPSSTPCEIIIAIS